jgi:hypothetical protein
MRLNRYLRAQGTSSDRLEMRKLQPPGLVSLEDANLTQKPKKNNKTTNCKRKKKRQKSRTPPDANGNCFYGGCGAGCCSRTASAACCSWGFVGLCSLAGKPGFGKVRKVRLRQGSCLFADIAGLEAEARCYFACCFVLVGVQQQLKAPPKEPPEYRPALPILG